MAFRTNKTPVLQTKSASGSVATFNTALAMPLSSCNIAVNAWQEGSGDPSPDNDRPIHGVDTMRIGMVDWNCLYDFTENSTRWKSNGTVTRTWSDGALTISNGNTNSAYAYQEFQETSGHKMLYICEGQSVDPVDRGCALSIYVYGATTDITKYFSTTRTVLSGIFASETTMKNRMQFRPNNAQSKVIVYKSILVDITQAFGARIANYLYTLEQAQEGAGVAIFKQLFYKDYYDYNVGGTWVSVASVNGDSYPDYAEIALGQEVYGAEVDVVNGVAHVNTGIKEMDENSVWEWQSQYVSSGIITDMLSSTAYDGLCNIIPVIDSIGTGIMIGSNSRRVYIGKSFLNSLNITSLDEWKALVANTHLFFTYPLANPFDIQLTPTQIQTLIGNNTIFADTGDIDLTYKDLDIAKRGNFREVFKLPS